MTPASYKPYYNMGITFARLFIPAVGLTGDEKTERSALAHFDIYVCVDVLYVGRLNAFQGSSVNVGISASSTLRSCSHVNNGINFENVGFSLSELSGFWQLNFFKELGLSTQ